MNFYYGEKRALEDISVKIRPNVVTAFIGPSGCGKSTFLRTLNRMNDIIPGTRVEGTVTIDGDDIYRTGHSTSTSCAAKSGWCFRSRTRSRNRSSRTWRTGCASTAWRERDRSWPGASRRACSRRRSGTRSRIACRSRRWRCPAVSSSGCASRARSPCKPEILLMDEPASALDPIATQRIEELVYNLKKQYTVVIVTHNMQQAARVSDYTAFFWLGRLVEYDRTDKIFTAPSEKLTEDYITGRFG